jgi:hypothetical protein
VIDKRAQAERRAVQAFQTTVNSLGKETRVAREYFPKRKLVQFDLEIVEGFTRQHFRADPTALDTYSPRWTCGERRPKSQ